MQLTNENHVVVAAAMVDDRLNFTLHAALMQDKSEQVPAIGHILYHSPTLGILLSVKLVLPMCPALPKSKLFSKTAC